MSPVLQHYMAAPLRLRWYTVATAVLLVLVAPAAAAQPVTLLPAELSMLVAAAIDTHPSIKSARANRRAALQDIDAARRAKWPTVSATTEANVGGPDTTSQVAAIRIEQTLWDQGAQDARIAAMNPCPCGYLGHPTIACTDTLTQVLRYQGKLSGPLLDRIDLHVSVQSVPYQSLLQSAPGEATATVRERVMAAHGRAMQRQQQPNARLTGECLTSHATLDAPGHQFLQAVATRFQWSARRLHRVLRVARTIADLADADAITSAHLSEAVQYQRVLQA